MSAIAYLVPEFPSQTHAFFWREIEALRQLGADVRLLSTRRPPADASRHAFTAEAVAQTRYLFPPHAGRALLTLLRHPRGCGRALRYVTRLPALGARDGLKLLGLLACAADLLGWAQQQGVTHVHLHSCADAAHLGALAHALGGLSYSASLHGDLPVYGRHHAQKLAQAAFVAGVTHPLLQQLRDEAQVAPERLLHCPMGVDTARFQPALPAQAAQTAQTAQRATAPTASAGPLRCIMVARLNPTKGHTYALQAVQQLQQQGRVVQLEVLGSGPWQAQIEAEIGQRGLAQQVRLRGSCSEAEVLQALQASQVLLLPSFGHGEAAPVAVMEAMACGVVPVASIIGGTPELIDDGLNGFLVPQCDAGALAQRLQQLADAPDTTQRLAQAARAKALSQFSALENARRLLQRIQHAQAAVARR